MNFYSAQQFGIWVGGRSLGERAPILTFAVACAWAKILARSFGADGLVKAIRP
jgi:hypothetical protein